MAETIPASDVNSRHRALQEELKELVDVVGPVPLVDLLLERAFEVGTTDIHFDPGPDGLNVRLRVDGILHDVLQLNTTTSPQVISRLKLLGGMDITERRYMQDGHIANSALRDQRDIRVGSGPTLHGERVVLRLMPAADSYSSIDDLGFEESQMDAVHRAIRVPHGMILSVGPVGSGKSTTTYAFLNQLNEHTRSLVTIEDPVERRIERAVQIQTDAKNKFGFVEALRGCLRQDPNVIMVGEIR
ncbi:MAG: Flp pilus assembly complex ATPase component TadA, partial [Planctomycetaceae bacterium]|nr:Flp pilus assembly complex ATPase component TadA [Planctomycetaceae bacterium]